jgi:hypothetical protein
VPAVLVVNLLAGDVDQARRDLQPLYDGILCVSPGRITHSRLTEAAHKGVSLARDTRNGIWAISGLGPTEEETGREPIKVHLLVVDERLTASSKRSASICSGCTQQFGRSVSCGGHHSGDVGVVVACYRLAARIGLEHASQGL